jgi:hypothetical protein
VRAVAFPYIPYQGHPAPIIPIAIQGTSGWTTVWAYVDSGASTTILTIREAGRLGVHAESGQLLYSAVGDGSLIPVYFHRMAVRIGSVELTVAVGFSPRLGIGFNLLGRQDIFHRFDVTFSDTRQRVTFRPTPQVAQR